MLTVLLGGLLLGSCGSGGKTAVDTLPPPPPPDTGVSISPDAQVSCPAVDSGAVSVDTACDEDALGVDWCIKNSAGGGGTIVTRQNPVDYNTCKL